MKTAELKKGMRVWCWWKSNHYYYDACVGVNQYRFIDIADEVEIFTAQDVAMLRDNK